MSIDFNKALVFDPKIEIVGEEVPLAAMEKTGAVLQDRYDKSYEQYSLADEALKQMEASANPIDRDKAKELRDLYSQEMQGILQKGDFHNMRHQVSALARNAAANYKTIAERNQIIQQNIDAIKKDPRYQLDPEGAVKHYLKGINSVNINPETRTVSDFNVGTYGAAPDVDVAKFFLQVAPTLRTKTKRGKDAKFATKTFDGNTYIVKETEDGQIERLSKEEIVAELGNYAKADQGIMNYLMRDVERAGLDINTKKGQNYLNELFNSRVTKAATAVAPMYDVYKDSRRNDFQVIGEKKSNNLNDPYAGTYSPNDVFQDYKTQGKLEFPDLLNSALQNNKKSQATLLSSLDYMAQNGNPTALEAKKIVKGLTEFAKKYPEYSNILRRQTAGESNVPFGHVAQAFLNLGSLVYNRATGSKARFDAASAEADKLIREYNKLADRGILDSKFENEFEAATSTAPMIRKLPIVTPNLESTEVREALNKLSTDLNINKFDIVEGEWKNKDKSKIKISGYTLEPYGSGTGIAFELMDEDGNTVIATPNKVAEKDVAREMAKISPFIYSSMMYKDMTPLSYPNQIKTFEDISEETGMNLPKGYKIKLLEDGTYVRITPSGNVDARNQSPYLLLPIRK